LINDDSEVRFESTTSGSWAQIDSWHFLKVNPQLPLTTMSHHTVVFYSNSFTKSYNLVSKMCIVAQILCHFEAVYNYNGRRGWLLDI